MDSGIGFVEKFIKCLSGAFQAGYPYTDRDVQASLGGLNGYLFNLRPQSFRQQVGPVLIGFGQ